MQGTWVLLDRSDAANVSAMRLMQGSVDQVTPLTMDAVSRIHRRRHSLLRICLPVEWILTGIREWLCRGGRGAVGVRYLELQP